MSSDDPARVNTPAPAMPRLLFTALALALAVPAAAQTAQAGQ